MLGNAIKKVKSDKGIDGSKVNQKMNKAAIDESMTNETKDIDKLKDEQDEEESTDDDIVIFVIHVTYLFFN